MCIMGLNKQACISEMVEARSVSWRKKFQIKKTKASIKSVVSNAIGGILV